MREQARKRGKCEGSRRHRCTRICSCVGTWPFLSESLASWTLISMILILASMASVSVLATTSTSASVRTARVRPARHQNLVAGFM